VHKSSEHVFYSANHVSIMMSQNAKITPHT